MWYDGAVVGASAAAGLTWPCTPQAKLEDRNADLEDQMEDEQEKMKVCND